MGFGSIRRFINERPVLGVIGTSIGVIALVVFVGVIDVRRVAAAYERSRSATLTAVVVAVVAALATVLAAIIYRRHRERLGSTARRVLGSTAIVWAVMFAVAVAVTHSRLRDDDLTTPLAVGVVSYCLVILAVAAAAYPFVMRAQARGRPHEPRDLVEVWHVRDDDPYFIAYCECGWVGSAYDESEPDACNRAFREAREHGTNVASEVAYPLGS